MARSKYGSTCQRSSQFNSKFPCENALDPFWITAVGWASQANQSPRPWITVFFSKIYNIIELCIVQRYANVAFTFKEVKVTMGIIIDNVYLLNYISTCFLFQNENGIEASNITVEGYSYISNEYANGFNSIQAYTKSNG